ncbi:MAG: fluoride efflux transporter CrcB [Actinomycetota bacterium]|nr:fluoride efflux transporter CrcB [Actinomycetota bacterium]
MNGVALVMLGGALGAPCRFWVDTAVVRALDRPLWVGTLVVNVIGCLVLGLVTGWTLTHPDPSWPAAFIGTGFCGALTTFSTFSVQAWNLVASGRQRTAVMAVAANTAIGGAVAVLGMVVTGGW